MSSDGSVTRWLGPLQAGEPAAVRQLWERFFHNLVGLARTKLQGAPRAVADEQDVALSAFDSFCRNAERGQFPNLVDRDSLWRLLLVIAVRKASRLVRDQKRQKRCGKTVSVSNKLRGAEEDPALDQVLSREPDPALATQAAEACQKLLNSLDDGELQSVALWKMEGYTVEEIAARLGCATRSVKRKLRLIRGIWEKEDVSDR